MKAFAITQFQHQIPNTSFFFHRRCEGHVGYVGLQLDFTC